MKDTVRQGTIAGLLGSTGDAMVHWTAYFVLGTGTTAHYISQLVYPFKDPSIARLFTGLVIHFFAGAFVGVLLAMVFKYFGSDHPYYKGLGMSALLWIVHVAIIPNMVSPRPIYRYESEALIDFIAHMVFGTIATTYWIKTSAGKIPT